MLKISTLFPLEMDHSPWLLLDLLDICNLLSTDLDFYFYYNPFEKKYILLYFVVLRDFKSHNDLIVLYLM